MPAFGQHETGLRLHLSGVGSLYALKEGESKALKVLQPMEGVWSEELLRQEIDSFLLRYKLQRKVAAATAFWAPVHEISAIYGKDEEGEYRAPGAYVVLNRYERSVQSLIEGRVHVTNDDLRNVLSGVLHGLIDIRKTLQRPHGNLKPSNILLAESVELAKAKVHLGDMAPDGAINGQSDRKDLFDFAKILYEMVNLRPYGGGTIGRTKDWDELGPNGEDWRKLCNTLLDTGANGDDLDLEKILARIATWTAKPKKSRTPILATAALVIVLIAGGLTAYFMTRKPHVDFNPQAWEELCLNYYSWFGDFSKHFADEGTKRKYTGPDYPPDIVKLFADANKELSYYEPKAIAGKLASADELAAEPSEDVKIDPGPYYTREGVKLIRSVSASLTPDRWPLLGKLDKTAAQYQERGWQKPAAGIRSLIAQARAPAIPSPAEKATDAQARVELVRKLVKDSKGNTDPVFNNIDATIQAARTVNDIDARWARIQELLQQLPPGDVPLVKALPEFAQEMPRSQADPAKSGTLADVTELAAAFTKIEALVGQLVTDLANKPGREIMYVELAKDPAAQLPASGKPTLEMYEKLPSLAANYVKLATDPRESVQWTKSLDALHNEIIAKIKEANPQDPNLQSLIDRHAKLSADVTGFGAANIPPIAKNKDRIVALVSKARTDLDKLTEDGNTWVAPYIIEPSVYIALQHERLATSPVARATPAVYAEWQKKHGDLLKKVEASPADLKKYQIYKVINAKFDQLEKTYLEFDTKIPAAVPGLAEIAASQNDWRKAVATQVATVYRENALKDLMANPALPWRDDLPVVTDPGYVSYEQQRLAAFDTTRKDALVLVADYVTVVDRLDHLQLNPNEPAPGAPLWRDLYAKYQSHPLVADSVIAAALKPLADRVAALLAIDAVNDYPTLLAKTEDAAPELVLTSWRKLGTVPVNESLPVLDDEEKASAALSSKLAALASAQKLTPAQVNAFTAEINAQKPLRWRRWADTLTSAAPIQKALDKAPEFQVTLSPQTDASMLYNQELYTLRKAFKPEAKEPELKAAAQAFIDRVKALPATISGDATIQGLLATIAKPLSTSQEESSTAGAGPKLAGWEQETPGGRPDVRIYYYPNKGAPRHVLEFARVQVNEANVVNPNAPPAARGAATLGAGQKTVFLCTSEMSIGLFADTLNNTNKVGDLDNSKTGNQPHWFSTAGDPWGGPRGWKISGNKFVLDTPAPGTPGWLFSIPQMGENPYYAANATPAPPALEHPMQYLSPWSAMYAARLLGCRLPTSDEWLAAYDRFEANKAAAPKDAWNLRGAAWKVEFDYVRTVTRLGMKYPDDTIFLTGDLLYAGITADAAKPWTGDQLAKLAPNRVTPGADPYKGSVLWFRKVASQPGSQPPGSGTGAMHDLVGNVGEYVYDGPSALAVIKDNNATTAAVDAVITAGRRNLAVIGGSALSPPDLVFNKKQPLDLTIAQNNTGYCDVGFRLAYTAPIDSITDVLTAMFTEPKYLPGPKAKTPG